VLGEFVNDRRRGEFLRQIVFGEPVDFRGLAVERLSGETLTVPVVLLNVGKRELDPDGPAKNSRPVRLNKLIIAKELSGEIVPVTCSIAGAELDSDDGRLMGDFQFGIAGLGRIELAGCPSALSTPSAFHLRISSGTSLYVGECVVIYGRSMEPGAVTVKPAPLWGRLENAKEGLMGLRGCPEVWGA